MSAKKNISFFVVAISVLQAMFAQSTRTFADPFTSDVITVDEKYTDYPYKGTNSFDVNYPVITGLKDTALQSKLNRRLFALSIKQLSTDSFRAKLFHCVKETMDTYFYVHGKEKNQLGLYNGYSFSPLIEDIDCKFFSYNKSLLTFVIDVQFETQYQKFLSENNFHFYQFYYFNIKTGKEYRPKDIFLPSKVKELNKKIEDIVFKNLGGFDFSDSDESEDEDFYDESVQAGTKRERALRDFSVTENCMPYFTFLSMACYIPAWTECTKNILGGPAEVRFSIAEIKEYLDPKGPFGFLTVLPPWKPTAIKNYENPFYEKFDSRFPKIEGYDIMQLTTKKSVKEVMIKKMTKVKAAAGGFENKEMLFKKLSYSADGKLIEMKYFSDNDRLYSSELYNYTKEGNLAKKTTFEDGKIKRTDDYYYDSKNNLLKKIETESGNVGVTTEYLYTNKFILEEFNTGPFRFDGRPHFNGRRHTFNDSLQIINTQYIDEGQISKHSESILKYDRKGRLIARYSVANPPSSGQLFVYENDGKLLSYEYDNSRHFTEYRYDESNNFIKEINSDNKTKTKTRKIDYNIKNLPEKIEITENNPPDPQIFTLYYEYWK